jgi:spermidine/putrescine transport system permease protein
VSRLAPGFPTTREVTALALRAPRDRSRTAAGWLLLSPALVTVMLFAVVPILVIARNSTAKADVFGGVTDAFTLDNYAKLADPVYAKTLGYSLGLAALTTVFCLVLGYAVSHYIVSRPADRQPILLLLLVIPFWTDFLVRTFAWISLLGRGGPVLGLLDLVGIEATSLVPSQTAVVLAMIYSFLPTAVFPIYAAMRGIDPSVKEAAADLGCGWWQTHFRIVAPLSLPGIVASVLLTFVPSLGVFVIPVLLGGAKDLLVGNLIVTLYTEFRNQPMGAALSMVLLGLMLLSLLLAGIVLRARVRRT